jgi:LysM repeat protein
MTATMHRPPRAGVTGRTVPVVHRTAVVTQHVNDDVNDDVNYTVRRFVAMVLVVVVASLTVVAGSAIVGALAAVDGRPAAAADAATAIVRVHVAQPGDTLWSIADRYRGDVGRDRFVDALIVANDGTVIQVGQAVRLP